MTRGQDSLVIDAGDAPAAEHGGAADRLQRARRSSSSRPTTTSSPAHAALLAEIDKASGGRAVWRASLPRVHDLLAMAQ